MTISSISSTPPQPVNGLVALPYAHHKKEFNGQATAPLAASAGTSTANVSSLASAIEATLAQLGLTAVSGPASSAANTAAFSEDSAGTRADSSSTSGALKSLQAFTAQLLATAQQAGADTASPGIGNGRAWATAAAGIPTTTADATGNTSFAALPQQPKAAQQIQQYRNIASTFSNLAQALSSSSSSASPSSSGATSLTAVFQNLWSSLSASSGTSTGSSGSTIPSLPSFLQTLARNFSESGISGLRGVFVDTVV